MLPTRKGSVRLFRLAGIDVFLHWSWVVVAIIRVWSTEQRYRSSAWFIVEYLGLFTIVLMHEFGHALACRQVGGKADLIVLWPLGGVAYVEPPQRPGPILWSIAAGPLVNLILAPVLIAAVIGMISLGWDDRMDLYRLVRNICIVDLVILFFNLLPIYPLDGGQILHALLWFWLGRSRALYVAAAVGFVGVALMGGVALLLNSIWFGILAIFILMHCWRGLLQARLLAKIERLPRREGFACPSCRHAPLIGALWVCSRCSNRFDTFETGAVCPRCGEQFSLTRCLDCGAESPIAQWKN